MTVQNLKLRVPVRFPTNVSGATGISVTKSGGAYTIKNDWSNVSTISAGNISDPAQKGVLLYDSAQQSYNVTTLTDLGTALFVLTSTTSLTIGNGSQAFTTQPNKDVSVGNWVIATSNADPINNYMVGQVTDYTTNVLTVNVTLAVGSGAHADWTIRGSGAIQNSVSTAFAVNRAAMQTVSTANKVTIVYGEGGRNGVFGWDSTDLSSNVTADTRQAIYVPPSSDTTGASGAWVRQFSGEVNAAWYGIVSDATVSAGVVSGTDNYAALQGALDSGYNVFIPAGSYAKTRTLRITTSGQTIRGEGRNKTNIYEQELTYTDGTYGVIAVNGLAIISGSHYNTISRLHLLGTSTDTASTTPCHGILCNSRAAGDRISGNNEDGYPTIDDVWIGGNTHGTNGYNNGIRNGDFNYLTLKNSLITDLVGQDGDIGRGYAVVGNGNLVTIRNNQMVASISGSGRHGIYFSFMTDYFCTDNYVYGFISSGIPINTSTTNANNQCIVARNIVDTCCNGSPYSDDAAIDLTYQGAATGSGSNLQCIDNIIKNSGRHGIVVGGFNRPRVSGNIIDGWAVTTSGHAAIKLTNCTDIGVSGNSATFGLNDSTSYFLFLQSNSYGSVIGNVFRLPSGTSVSSGIENNTTAPQNADVRMMANNFCGTGTWTNGYVHNPAAGGCFYVPMAGNHLISVIPDGTTTPDVGGLRFARLAYSADATVTNFINGYKGQEITLIITGGHVTLDKTNLYINGTVNWKPASTATITFVYDGTNWFEVSRMAA